MSLNDTPSSERINIGFFGCTNAGKSSLVNALTGQDLSIVSEKNGTTTDPVKKAMEILPLGPVVIIDTPGLDDESELGSKRVKRAKDILGMCDIAILVIDGAAGEQAEDRELIEELKKRKLPFLVVYNKEDLEEFKAPHSADQILCVSSFRKTGIDELKNRIASLSVRERNPKYLVQDLLEPGETAILVVPIDESAPKGRIILPQQLVMRDILDAHGTFLTCQPEELKQTVKNLNRDPKIVITDSQAFAQVVTQIPGDMLLTSFSILFARYRGDLTTLVRGAAKLKDLKSTDKVLISEGCTHHRQCNDIGTVKIPKLIRKYSGSEPEFTFTSGNSFTEHPEDYDLVIHCGACMLNEKEMKRRTDLCLERNTEIVNYGIAIACMNGILKRSLEPFPEVLKILEGES